MSNVDDDGLPIADPSDLGIDVIDGIYDELHDGEPGTIIGPGERRPPAAG
jgi:hypothetical protein